MTQITLKYLLKKLRRAILGRYRSISHESAPDTHEIVALAQALGSADAAIVVWKIQAWLTLNETANSADHFYEGRWWIHAHLKGLREDHFTWMSESQFFRLMTRLAESKILIRKKLKIDSETGYWYSIDEDILDALIDKNVVDISRQIYRASDIPSSFEHAYTKGTHREAPRSEEARQPSSGYVYLQQAKTGLYKIGMSTDIERRLRNFEGLPFDVSCICVIESPDMRHLEAFLHKRFASKRVKGEWFDLNADDVDYIRSLTVEGL